MEKVTLNVEFLFALNSQREWINRVPAMLPAKNHPAEEWIWIDTNGNSMAIGEDFAAAEKMESYPVKVYSKIRVAEALKLTETSSECLHDRYCDQQTKDQKCKSKSGCNFKE